MNTENNNVNPLVMNNSSDLIEIEDIELQAHAYDNCCKIVQA